MPQQASGAADRLAGLPAKAYGMPRSNVTQLQRVLLSGEHSSVSHQPFLGKEDGY
jgi:hypothetical protein